jgi:hypothetical protein
MFETQYDLMLSGGFEQSAEIGLIETRLTPASS